jgi:hypothetical protein
MWIQGVVLEHHGDIAIFGGYVVNFYVADVQLALGDFFQPGDHAQGGGFAATGRPNKDNKLLILNNQAKICDSRNAACIPLVNIPQ